MVLVYCSKMKRLRVFLNDKAVNFAKSLVNVKQYSTNIVQILLTIMVISLKSLNLVYTFALLLRIKVVIPN